MAKNTKKQKHFLDRYENSWQRTGIIVLLCLLISCLTFCVLLGAETLFAKGSSFSTECSPSSSACFFSFFFQYACRLVRLLPETADGGRSYLDDTLFLGDSNTVRFMAYNDET
jgi:hypothetical protein